MATEMLDETFVVYPWTIAEAFSLFFLCILALPPLPQFNLLKTQMCL